MGGTVVIRRDEAIAAKFVKQCLGADVQHSRRFFSIVFRSIQRCDNGSSFRPTFEIPHHAFQIHHAFERRCIRGAYGPGIEKRILAVQLAKDGVFVVENQQTALRS